MNFVDLKNINTPKTKEMCDKLFNIGLCNYNIIYYNIMYMYNVLNIWI